MQNQAYQHQHRSSDMGEYDKQLAKVRDENGFVAALDQSGGSTPKTLGLYGVTEDAWSNDDEMFDVMHAMRSRIMTSDTFNGDRVIGAILFEGTMDREVEGRGSAEYLWQVKNVVPFLKVDKGLEDESNGAQLMKPITGLDATLARAKDKGVFGTKMRSVIKQANAEAVDAIVQQQFDIGKQIISAGLMPILEPEVDIHCPDKQQAEELLLASLMKQLDALADDQLVMLKLTLPETGGHYGPAIEHKNVVKVVALSGGYDREEANKRLTANPRMVASFSRALAQGLNVQQSDSEFDATLEAAIDTIYQASKT